MNEESLVEFGVVHRLSPEILHRGPMTGTEAMEWIREYEECGGASGSFVMVSRVVTPWVACRVADPHDQ